ncbi:MAG: hypothetical protein E4H30_02325 [Methanomassiliicoccus sp.]|nr:MAG: hypothetical protein E4H30_02325 [Methanomassiliicoccus sp.]
MAELAYPKRPIKIFSLLLIITAVVFYWVWGIVYGSWNLFSAENLGVYAIFVVLLGFGVLGYLLTRVKK